MLLGQNVNSYRDTPDASPAFPELLRKVSEIDGISRIRFMTSHPKDFSHELIKCVAELPKVCKHVHLPVQSGSTRVLRDMNRKYSQEDYLDLIERLRAEIPNLAISTDIIVGYPGETEEDFEATLQVVRRARFSSAFTFLYSKRSGTPAAERTEIVPQKTASERYDRLVAEISPILLEINKAKIGEIFDTMVEEVNANDYKGRTDDHSLVHFTSEIPLRQGNIVPVKITTARTFYLTGTHRRF
jgi:tRNA-2-methylthio-N6-dimethylallyladenosine synthase